MTLPLPDEQLDQIRAREAAAFPGPWYTDSLTEADGSTSYGVAAKDDLLDDPFVVALQDLNPADAEFIAHARQDVPALLAEVERLRARVAELEANSEVEQPQARVADFGDWLNENAPEAPCPNWSRERVHGPHLWAAPNDGPARCPGVEEPPSSVVHACPRPGSGVTPCCLRTPFELPATDRLAARDRDVTCTWRQPTTA